MVTPKREYPDEIARRVREADPEPIEIFLVAIPVLCEAIAVSLFIAACAMGIIIWSTPL